MEDATLASAPIRIAARDCTAFLARLFVAAGVGEETAWITAEGLVEADLQATGSHGALQAPNYLRRLRAGTISTRATIELVHESAAVAVYDAGLALGHPAARQAMDAALALAGRFGIAAVAVRSATHFGMAGAHARRAAEAGIIGIVMCNTRPMMPAPGGAEAVVGNNPLAIAVPVAGGPPIVLDMAMSAVAMGRIRLAARQGESIPRGWAYDEDGAPTTDAAKALAGMLEPAAGAKGFGLALMIDLLAGLLSEGSVGGEVASMYENPATPADCSWLFVAIDPRHFGVGGVLSERAAGVAASIRESRRQPGVSAIGLPGERKLRAEAEAAGMVSLPAALVEELNLLADELGVARLEAGSGS